MDYRKQQTKFLFTSFPRYLMPGMNVITDNEEIYVLRIDMDYNPATS